MSERMYYKYLRHENGLTDFEKAALAVYDDILAPYKKQLGNQIQEAIVRRENCGASYFIDFYHNLRVDPLPLSFKAPITVIISKGIDLRTSNSELIRRFENDKRIVLPNPYDLSADYIDHLIDSEICINLFIKYGYITEIEIYSTVGSDIPINSEIFNGKQIVTIDEKDISVLNYLL